MKKLSKIFQAKKPTFSFEFFPPKTEAGFEKLMAVISQLARFDPDFISVTCGAFGGNREKTMEIVDYVQKKHNIVGVEHLTCIGNTREEIKKTLEDIKNHGIKNVLALRGDPPLDNPNWQPTKDHFRFSYELCQFIRKEFGDYFSMGVAGFPEGHVLCPSKEQDAQYLKMKVDAGADFIITQFFFENKDYFDYVTRLRKIGVTKPVIPGILPITDYNNVVNFSKKAGASIPESVKNIFTPIQNDPEAVLKAGINYTVKQCKELIKAEVPGIHFYPLNKSHPADEILAQIKS